MSTDAIQTESTSRVRRVVAKVRVTITHATTAVKNFFKRTLRSTKLSLTDPEPDTVIAAMFGSGFGRLAVAAYFTLLLAFAQLWIPAAIFFGWTVFEAWMLTNGVPLLASTLEYETAKRQMTLDYQSVIGQAPIVNAG